MIYFDIGHTRVVPGSAVDVASFVDHLAEMPLGAWLEIGRSLNADRAGLAARITSGMILDVTIAVNRLGVSAWFVSDAIETAAFLARRQAGRLSRRDRYAFNAAHVAAELAALSLLARGRLPAIDLRLLCEPFAERLTGGYPRPVAQSA